MSIQNGVVDKTLICRYCKGQEFQTPWKTKNNEQCPVISGSEVQFLTG